MQCLSVSKINHLLEKPVEKLQPRARIKHRVQPPVCQQERALYGNDLNMGTQRRGNLPLCVLFDSATAEKLFPSCPSRSVLLSLAFIMEAFRDQDRERKITRRWAGFVCSGDTSVCVCEGFVLHCDLDQLAASHFPSDS